MGWEASSGVVADLNLRIELRRLADLASRLDNGPLSAILEVAINSLDARIADPASYPPASGANPARPPGGLVCRNVRLDGRRTSVKLEPEFWQALDHLARQAGCSLDELCRTARRRHASGGLASAIRVFVLASLAEPPPSSGGREKW